MEPRQMTEIMLLNGPNLNLLGSREPEIYGRETLSDINHIVGTIAKKGGCQYSSAQSNAEHELIELVHNAKGKAGFIIINPGAFTHTSIGLRDAFLGVSIPFIEVHLSNVFSREDFRKHSFLSDIAVGCISGLGSSGYRFAAEFAVNHLEVK
jgi:3-dehydroquinate dehydratase-2